jgi:hypothetical protein
MKLNSLLSSIGAMSGAILTAVLYFTIGLGWIMLTVVSIVILAAYITAAVSVKPALKVSEEYRRNKRPIHSQHIPESRLLAIAYPPLATRNLPISTFSKKFSL